MSDNSTQWATEPESRVPDRGDTCTPVGTILVGHSLSVAAISVGDWGGTSAVGARIEAPKAPRGVGYGEGVSPSPPGEGSEEGAVPPPQKIFRFLSSKRRVFVHSGCNFCS